MKQTILVVDDKLNVQKLIEDFLAGKGYEVLCASNGRDAQLILAKQTPDLILLDIMMPQMDGYEFIQHLRKENDIPVIMITAKQQEEDVVKGFELGADDYITKPFRMAELLVRIQAVLRRATSHYANHKLLKLANIVLDTNTRELKVDNLLLELTQAELSLMTQLLKAAGHSVTKADLCNQLISEGFSGSESTLKIHMRNLRNKLEPVVKDGVVIESVFGVGYRLREAL